MMLVLRNVLALALLYSEREEEARKERGADSQNLEEFFVFLRQSQARWVRNWSMRRAQASLMCSRPQRPVPGALQVLLASRCLCDVEELMRFVERMAPQNDSAARKRAKAV